VKDVCARHREEFLLVVDTELFNNAVHIRLNRTSEEVRRKVDIDIAIEATKFGIAFPFSNHLHFLAHVPDQL